MRLELKRIHAQFPVTTVYVTHDQVEAMTMADRIALMSHGQLQQTASPEYIYDHPANAFVASFVGSPKINFFQGTLVRDGGTPRVTFLECSLELISTAGDAVQRLGHSSVTVGFRPEEVRLAPAAGGRLPTAKCVVELVEPLGPETNLVVRSGEETWVCKVRARSGLAVGDVVTLEFDTSQVKLFDTETGTAELIREGSRRAFMEISAVKRLRLPVICGDRDAWICCSSRMSVRTAPPASRQSQPDLTSRSARR